MLTCSTGCSDVLICEMFQLTVWGVPEETLYTSCSAGASHSSAAAEPDQECGDEELSPLTALGQAVLLHPFAVQRLMAR